MAGQFVKANAIAKLLMITTRHLQRLVSTGAIPRHSRGNYELVPCVQAYIRYLQDAKTEGAVPGDPHHELTSLKVERARMDLAREKRELVPVHGLQQYAEQLGAVMHSALETLPGQIKTLIPHLRTGEIKQIRQLLVRVQNGIASVDFIHKRAA